MKTIIFVLVSVALVVAAFLSVSENWVDKAALNIAATVSTFLVVGWYTWETNQLRHVAIRSAEIAESAAQLTSLTFEASHRPYFAVEQIEAHTPDVPEKAVIKVTSKNYGSVPLRVGDYSVRAIVTPSHNGTPGEPQSNEFEPLAPTVLLPGEQGLFFCELRQKELFTLVASGKATLVVDVRLGYVSLATGKAYAYKSLHTYLADYAKFGMQESSMD
ncbi:MAG TPA: hypothetical protein VGK29_22895 [Paludibaculum sp.]